MKKLRAGIIGLGVGEQHISGYESHPNCEVVAVCDFDENKLQSVKSKYPHLRTTKNAEDLISAKDIDVLSIASFDNHHHSQVLAGLRSEKHLFVEKPLCMNEQELEQIYKECQKRPHLKMSSNLILRMSPRFQNLRSRIKSGELGEIFCVEGDYNYGRIHKIHSGWRGEIPGYSVILGGAIHLIDLVLWLTGGRIKEVVGYGNRLSSRSSIFQQNDLSMNLLKFENGMTGKVSSNYACVYPHFHRLSIYGTNGTFENGLSNAMLFRSREPGNAPQIINDPYPGTRKGDLIYSFVESILGKSEAIVSQKEVFDVMSVCLAMERSIAENKNIAVNYF